MKAATDLTLAATPRGERPPDLDLARTRNPYALISASRAWLASIRLRVLGDDPDAIEWHQYLTRNADVRDAVLGELEAAAHNLARLTLLVEACGSADPELFLDLADRADELHELRAEIAARKVPA